MSNIKLIFFASIIIIIYLIKNPHKYNHIMNMIQQFIDQILNQFLRKQNLYNQSEENTKSSSGYYPRISVSPSINKIESPNPPGEFGHGQTHVEQLQINEGWRDLPYIGNKDVVTYHRSDQNVSRKNLPIYYPISSPLEDNYFNYLGSITSPKLSMLRNIMRSVEVYTNQGMQPIIFNYGERPIEIQKVNFQKINVLAKTVIDLINKFAGSTLRVEFMGTKNEVHEETEEQSKINFDMKVKLFYFDVEKLGKTSKPEHDIIYIQPEFIFEKKYNILPEDQFFRSDSTLGKPDFRVFLSKLMIVGSEHQGFLGGRHGSTKNNKQRGREYNI